MNLLAIETASETCSVALSVGDQILERYQQAPRKHAERLLPWIGELLAEAGLAYTAIDAIAFSRGPGSFTSLRIGIGVVQGLAWASDRPVVPVSSLAATAQAAVADGVSAALVAMDARMDEVFTGRFEVNANGIMQPVSAERVCPPEAVQTGAVSEVFGIGNGFARYEALAALATQLAGVRPDVWPRASCVLQIAREWLTTHEPLPAEQAQPVYLRDDVAKKSVS